MNSQEPINPFEAPAREAGAAADRSSENPFGDTPAIAADEHRGTPLPWEERMGLVSWWQTAWLILVSPSEAFSRMNPRGQIGRAILFAMLGTMQARVLATVIGLLVMLLTVANELVLGWIQSGTALWLILGFVTVVILEPPLVVGFTSLLFTALLHPCVMLWKRSAAFVTTWKVLLFLLVIERFGSNISRGIFGYVRTQVDLLTAAQWSVFIGIVQLLAYATMLVFAIQSAQGISRGRSIGVVIVFSGAVTLLLAGLGFLIFYLGQLG